MPAFVEIVLPIPLDRTFTYAVPEALKTRAVLGMRVVAPMRNRVETGYITAVNDTAPDFDTKAIIDLPDDQPVFQPNMLALCRWLADYYCCSWGEALQCAVPAGMKIGTKMRYTLMPDQLQGRFTDRQKKLIAVLSERGPLTEGQLGAEIGRTALSNTLQALARRGVLLAEPIKKEATASILTETWVCLVAEAVPDGEALAAFQRRAAKQAAVYLDLLHGQAEQPATLLYDRHKVNSTTLRALEEKGLVRREERELYRAPAMEHDARAMEKHALNAEQNAAYDAISERLRERAFQTFLLQGITGSGKTEVYLQAIEETLALGRDAIILVPEISLTPQTVGRFFARFQQQIAVLHSGLSTGERYDEWRRAQRGEVRIVVGARSAIFAPLPDVGIIVVDEEHDTSYKQGESPRYHARDVAIMRAKRNNAVCVLGSATPSVESFHNSESGKSVRLELLKRATRSPLPEVKLIDMRLETKEQGGQVVLSRELEAAVHKRVAAKEQVILLLNRRGYAPFILCPQCGWVHECEDCNVSLTYHASGAVMKCHYCNREEAPALVCYKCHFNPLIKLGTGTQRAEEYLEHVFSSARVARMDADTTAGKGGHAKILGRFAAGEIDILIGTQMLAKGHDYPGVTLVGVVNADTGLALPDFRAAEQSFQLLTQVAGRAGRGDKPGEVLVQTFRPKHYAVQAAAHHDYGTFYQQEIGFRENAGYPPFRRMANFMVESEDPALVQRAAMRLSRLARDEMERLGFDGMELMGPAPASIRRVSKRYRWQLGILSKSVQRINAVTRATRDAFQEQSKTGKVKIKVDLDPYGMY